MTISSMIVSLACIAVVWTFWFFRSKRSRSGLHYPPGPRGLPLIGSALDVNMKDPHLTYTDWGRKYGDLVYCRLLGHDCIIVNSKEAALSLAEKRSTIYSDRMHSPLYKIIGIACFTPVLKYGDVWRMHRKLYHQTLFPMSLKKHEQSFLDCAKGLICNLIQDDDSKHIKQCLSMYSSSLALGLSYGHKVQGMRDPLCLSAHEVLGKLNTIGRPEKAVLLATFPILQHLLWMPGLGLTCTASCKEITENLVERCFKTARQSYDSGVLPSCMVFDVLSKGNINTETEAALKVTAAMVFFAGEETTSATLSNFLLAMVLFPDIQTKAQAEIDAVVGRNRSPTFEDRPRLPYLQAVIYEVMRWWPVAPHGCPRLISVNDVYEGYHIPKGSLIIFNTWALSRSCLDPYRFDPGRYLSADGQLLLQAKKDMEFVFGYGRRICPGRYLADTAIWTAAAFMLWALRIDKAKDLTGQDVEFEPAFVTGILRIPEPFPCSITRRSDVSF